MTAADILRLADGAQFDLLAEGLSETDQGETLDRVNSAYRQGFLEITDHGLYALTAKAESYLVGR